MNLKTKIIIIASISFVLLLAGLIISQSRNNIGAFSGPGFNIIDRTTHTAVSTSTTLPIKLLSTNRSRIMAIIENNGTADIYIHLNNFASGSAASTTVKVNTGIRLTSGGGSYEILPENLYNGEVWVATTTAAQSVLVTEL